jgi:hypothetical protein
MVDFSGVSVQKIDKIRVSKNKLILTRKNSDYQCKIKAGKHDFVQKLIEDAYFNNGIFLNKEINTSELKMLPAIDFNEQTTIKNYIDDLIFTLYFNIALSKLSISEALNIKKLCQKNNFYKYILE